MNLSCESSARPTRSPLINLSSEISLDEFLKREHASRNEVNMGLESRMDPDMDSSMYSDCDYEGVPTWLQTKIPAWTPE